MKRIHPKTVWSQTASLLRVLGYLACLAGFAVCPSWAQSLAIAPGQMEYRFKPGVPFKFELAISNRGAAPVFMKMSVTDFWYNEKNDKLFTSPGTSPQSAANWIEFVPRQITVPADGSGKVQVIVTPPAQAAGGYYAVVFAESKPQLAEQATTEKKAVYTNMRLGSLVLLSAENTETYKIEVSDAKFSPPTANDPLKLVFTLANKGNSHIFPVIKVAVLNSKHEVVLKTEGETKRFLPGQKDQVSARWAGTLPLGDYTAILTVLYGNDSNYTQEFPFTQGAAK
jgi:hypothetical protein